MNRGQFAKKKTKRRSGRLTTSQALIRKQAASTGAVEHLRKTLSLPSLQSTLAWTLRRFRSQRHIGGIRPKASFQLPDFIIVSEDTSADAIKWMLASCEISLLYIKSHNANVHLGLENAVDFVGAHQSSIDELTIQMWNYSAISSALFSLARTRGLDAQRKWMRAQAYISHPSISNIVLYSKGIACEGDRHPFDIWEILNKFIFSKFEDEDLTLFVWYLALSPAINWPAAQRLIRLSLYIPAIDQYEILANVVSSDGSLCKSNEIPYLSEVLDLMERARDWRAPCVRSVGTTFDRDRIRLPFIGPATSELLRNLEVNDDSSYAANRGFDTLLANEFLPQPQSPRGYLASSLFAFKTSESKDDILIAHFRRRVAEDFFNQQTPSSSTEENFVDFTFEGVSQAIPQAFSAFEKRELFRIACICGITEGKIIETLVFLFNFSSEDRNGVAYFPSELLFSKTNEDDIAAIGHDPRVAVALSRIASALGDAGQNMVFVAVEQRLTTLGILTPSEVTITTPEDIAFLHEACTSTSLRQSLEFLSKEAMEGEWISILLKLAQADPENEASYIAEVHDIIGQQTIDELLQRFHVGKVQCDEKALASWAEIELLPKFNRLQDFISAGLLPVERNADVEFIAHLTSGKMETFTFKVPSNESLDIARSILSELIQKYAFDPRYGVDSYLSLGMRHGAVAAHLRSPLSNENILTAKDLLEYPDDCFWKNYYIENDETYVGEKIGPLLARFSEKFDNKLEEIKNELLQVKRLDKPKGLIVAEWSEASVLSFCALFAEVTNFHLFIAEFTSVFWANIENNLREARSYIETVLASELNQLVDELEAELRAATGQQRLAPFSDAVMRARQELGNAIKDLSSWHNVARSTDIEPLGVVDIIHAAQKIVCRLYPDFSPRVSFSGDTGISLTYSLHILIEVFKALFMNVYEHSGRERPSIDLKITVIGQDALGVHFISDCEDLDRAERAAVDINEKIRTGEYEKKLPKEGGSGLAKVARSTVRDGIPNTEVGVDRESSRFRVGMIFSLVNL